MPRDFGLRSRHRAASDAQPVTAQAFRILELPPELTQQVLVFALAVARPLVPQASSFSPHPIAVLRAFAGDAFYGTARAIFYEVNVFRFPQLPPLDRFLCNAATDYDHLQHLELCRLSGSDSLDLTSLVRTVQQCYQLRRLKSLVWSCDMAYYPIPMMKMAPHILPKCGMASLTLECTAVGRYRLRPPTTTPFEIFIQHFGLYESFQTVSTLLEPAPPVTRKRPTAVLSDPQHWYALYDQWARQENGSGDSQASIHTDALSEGMAWFSGRVARPRFIPMASDDTEFQDVAPPSLQQLTQANPPDVLLDWFTQFMLSNHRLLDLVVPRSRIPISLSPGTD